MFQALQLAATSISGIYDNYDAIAKKEPVTAPSMFFYIINLFFTPLLHQICWTMKEISFLSPEVTQAAVVSIFSGVIVFFKAASSLINSLF